MKILLCHVFVPTLPRNAGGPEPACQVTPLAHPHEYTLGIPARALPSATSNNVSLLHRVSHRAHRLQQRACTCAFPPYNVQQTYIIGIVLSNRT